MTHACRATTLGLLLAAAAGGTVALVLLPRVSALCATLIGVNTLSFVLYAYDKLQARRGACRVPEAALLAAAALGGSPGALLAMIALRHKTRKSSFRRAFFAISLAQAALLTWYWIRLSPGGPFPGA